MQNSRVKFLYGSVSRKNFQKVYQRFEAINNFAIIVYFTLHCSRVSSLLRRAYADRHAISVIHTGEPVLLPVRLVISASGADNPFCRNVVWVAAISITVLSGFVPAARRSESISRTERAASPSDRNYLIGVFGDPAGSVSGDPLGSRKSWLIPGSVSSFVPANVASRIKACSSGSISIS